MMCGCDSASEDSVQQGGDNLMSGFRLWDVVMLQEGWLGHVDGDVSEHGVERSRGDGLTGEGGLGDAVQTKGARRLAQAAPGRKVPAMVGAKETGEFDDAHRLAALGVAIGELDSDRRDERLLHDVGYSSSGGIMGSLHDANMGEELSGRVPGRRGHHGGELLERGAAGSRQGRSAEGGKSRGESGGFGRREVQGGQSRLDVEAVPAARAGLGPNGHTGLLEGQQVAFNGAGADLEVLS